MYVEIEKSNEHIVSLQTKGRSDLEAHCQDQDTHSTKSLMPHLTILRLVTKFFFGEHQGIL